LFRRKAKIKPRQSSPGKLGNLVEILQDGVCIANLEGEIIYLNESGYKLLNLSQNNDVNEHNFFEENVKDRIAIVQLKEILEKESLVNNFELQLNTFNDQKLDVLLTINFLYDYRQERIGFLFLFKDVTEIKKIQNQLLQTQKLESVGSMASGIAHDFNNILAAIIPNAELIKMTSKEGTENYTRAEIIENSALRASEIAQRLLAFTRYHEHEKTSVNLNEIIKESIDLFENAMPDSIEIDLNLQEDLFNITADATQIQQVVMNLLLNAKDAMPDGGTIGIRTMKHQIDHNFQQGTLNPGQYIKLIVEDNGQGIPIEILPKIFDPFFTTKDVGKGSGLGLSMVYGIIKKHDGETFVHSIENEGTKFEILLPADEKGFEKVSEEISIQHVPEGLGVLVVDDEPYVRDILTDILKFLGCNVIKAESGRQAIEIFSSEKDKIDYAVVDMRMPKMDGPAAISELRKINPDVKIITTSGFDDRSVEFEKKENIVGFLPKPYSLKSVSKSFKQLVLNGS
jgi:PAS domain S-box-containing protein